jgi:hypothetical protein
VRSGPYSAVFSDELPGSTHQPRPPLASHQFAREHQWDIQVATVGLTPLAPTIRVGGPKGGPAQAPNATIPDRGWTEWPNWSTQTGPG